MERRGAAHVCWSGVGGGGNGGRGRRRCWSSIGERLRQILRGYCTSGCDAGIAREVQDRSQVGQRIVEYTSIIMKGMYLCNAEGTAGRRSARVVGEGLTPRRLARGLGRGAPGHARRLRHVCRRTLQRKAGHIKTNWKRGIIALLVRTKQKLIHRYRGFLVLHRHRVEIDRVVPCVHIHV